jgi:hypothetical protein
MKDLLKRLKKKHRKALSKAPAYHITNHAYWDGVRQGYQNCINMVQELLKEEV